MPSLAKLPLLRCLKRYDGLLLLVSLALVLMYVLSVESGFPLDDAWIHQVYGRNLGLVGEWAFVVGQASAASTAPLYTILLSLGYRLGIAYPLWTHGLGLLALWLTGVLAARWAEQWALLLGKRGGWWRRIGLIAGLFQIGAWHLLWAATSGMETALFGMWTLAVMLIAITPLGSREEIEPPRRQERQGVASPLTPFITTATNRLAPIKAVLLRGLLFGICAGLATLTRPEGVALAGLLGLLLLLTGWYGDWRRGLVWGGAAALAFALTIAPYALFNLRLTGGLLPDTAAAKQAEYAALLQDPLLLRLVSMLLPLTAGVQFLLVPGAIAYAYALARRVRQDRRWLLVASPLLWAFGLVLLYAVRLPTPYQHGRYVIPALPAFILAGVCGMAYLLESTRRSLLGRVLTRALAAASVTALLYFALATGLNAYQRDVRIINQEMVTTARWVAAHVPPEALLVVHDIGALGYFAPRPIMDLAGLVSPEVVPFIRDPQQLWAWMQAGGGAYLMAFPDQVPDGAVNDPRLCKLFESAGAESLAAGGENMAVYRLSWNQTCD